MQNTQRQNINKALLISVLSWVLAIEKEVVSLRIFKSCASAGGQRSGQRSRKLNVKRNINSLKGNKGLKYEKYRF